MTASDLLELFLTRLVREAGGTRRRWRAVVGAVRLYPVATHPHCNWAVHPSGAAGENAAVERVADDLRARHPIVDAG
jgi:hypothetical protein